MLLETPFWKYLKEMSNDNFALLLRSSDSSCQSVRNAFSCQEVDEFHERRVYLGSEF